VPHGNTPSAGTWLRLNRRRFLDPTGDTNRAPAAHPRTPAGTWCVSTSRRSGGTRRRRLADPRPRIRPGQSRPVGEQTGTAL